MTKNVCELVKSTWIPHAIVSDIAIAHKHEIENKHHKDHSLESEPLKFVPQACRITHVYYADSGQSIAFLANRNAELAKADTIQSTFI